MTDFATVVRLGLLLVRVGMVVASTPAFGGVAAPPTVKIGLSLILAFLLLPIVPIPEGALAPGLPLIVAREAAIGVAIAMAVRILLAGAELAGQLAGFQLGFAYATLVDPQTGARNSQLATLYGTLALFTFLGVNGHHALIRGLADSYAALPIGAGAMHASMGQLVARMLGLVFILGAQLAAPVVIVLLIVEVALGLITRAAPALNIMVVGFPVRLIVGLLVLAVAIQAVPAVVARFAPPALALAMRAALAFR